MIDEAYNLLAIQAVRLKAQEMNQTILSYLTDPNSFCNFVVSNGDNTASPLYVGLPYCLDRQELTATIHNNVISQIEKIGQPFSSGDETSGLRLLMGSDLTQYEAIVVADPTNSTNQDLIAIPTETRWLFPANLEQFDPRCNTTDVQQAAANGCSAVGKFESCATGCGLNPGQEQLWDSLPDSLLGVPKKNWDVAGWLAWRDLRGAIAQYTNKTGGEGPVDALLFLENPPFDGGFGFKFVGMSDRPWWIGKSTQKEDVYFPRGRQLTFPSSLRHLHFFPSILLPYNTVNQTTMIRPENVFFDEIPASNNFPPQKDSGLMVDGTYVGDCGYISDNNFEFNNNLYQDACDTALRQKMNPFAWVEPNLMLESACFVASKSPRNDGEYKTVPASKYSPTGVYCSSLDFRYLYERTCQVNDKASPCCLGIYGRSSTTCPECTLRCETYNDPVKKLCTTRVPEKVRNMIGQDVDWKRPQPSNCGWAASLEVKQGCGSSEPSSMAYTLTAADCSVGNISNYRDMPDNYVQHPWMLTFRNRPINESTINEAADVPDMFRLPVVDLNKVVCTPSPFLFAGHADDPDAPRPRRSIAGFPMPCKHVGGD